ALRHFGRAYDRFGSKAARAISASRHRMSALPRKRTNSGQSRDVRLVPIAAVSRCSNTNVQKTDLLDHFVGAQNESSRSFIADPLRGLQIDDQLEAIRLLHRNIGGLGAAHILPRGRCMRRQRRCTRSSWESSIRRNPLTLRDRGGKKVELVTRPVLLGAHAFILITNTQAAAGNLQGFPSKGRFAMAQEKDLRDITISSSEIRIR